MASTPNPTGPSQRTGSKPPPQPPSPWAQFRSARFWIWLLVLLAFNIWITNLLFAPAQPPTLTLPYNVFKQQVVAGNVLSITSTGDSITGTTKTPVQVGSEKGTHFFTQRPAFADSDLEALLEQHNVTINAKPDNPGLPFWEQAILSFGPTILIILGVLYFSRRLAMNAGGGAGGILGAFGQSRARVYDAERPQTTFADVAGIDDAKQDLQEVVDFLKQPEKYQRLGGTVPKGVLLIGPPGTGKTLLARAVAGEADVPFFSQSASEFVEAIVGVGASRVRDLFAQAKAAAPAIVFIDELDAIGRARGGNIAGLGGSDEREQTLNQILTEMDGFDSSTNVIVLGATNRPDVLDPALLRPGRFDRRVAVQPPDRAGRQAILAVHARGVPLGPDVDLGRIAATTPGMVGADLANLVNEAALLAARRNHDVVMEADVTDALERIVLGAERQVMMSHEDKRRTAYHEGGHAIVGMLTEGADPVRKISIIPRGVSLGVTFSAPEADRYSYERRELEAKIKVALGGRSAEEIVFDEPTTGAESDIQQLTEIARQMVGRWGMSTKIGPVAVTPVDGRGPFLPGAAEVSQHTQELIDDEVRRIVEAAHEQVVALLKEHRDKP